MTRRLPASHGRMRQVHGSTRAGVKSQCPTSNSQAAAGRMKGGSRINQRRTVELSLGSNGSAWELGVGVDTALTLYSASPPRPRLSSPAVPDGAGPDRDRGPAPVPPAEV